MCRPATARGCSCGAARTTMGAEFLLHHVILPAGCPLQCSGHPCRTRCPTPAVALASWAQHGGVAVTTIDTLAKLPLARGGFSGCEKFHGPAISRVSSTRSAPSQPSEVLTCRVGTALRHRGAT